MGDKAYVGWAVLMASSILFSTILGILLGEWKGTGSRTKTLLGIGIAVLLGSSVITGRSGYLKGGKKTQPEVTLNAKTPVQSSEGTIRLAAQNVQAEAEVIDSTVSTTAESKTGGNITIIKADLSATNVIPLKAPSPAPEPIEGVDTGRKQTESKSV